MGVRQEEVQGQHFLRLDSGLPIDQVRPALRAAMSGDNGTRSTLIQATNRRGTDRAAAGSGSVRVRGLEPLTRRLAADVADLGAP